MRHRPDMQHAPAPVLGSFLAAGLLILLLALVVACMSCSTPNPPKAPDGYDVDTNTNDTRRYIGIPQ